MVLDFSFIRRHRALRDDPPAPTLVHLNLQVDRLRSVESNMSRAEHPAGLPSAEHHRNLKEPQNLKRRSSLGLPQNFISQSSTDGETETQHSTAVQEDQDMTLPYTPSHTLTH